MDQVILLYSTISTSPTNAIKKPAIHILEELTSHLKVFKRNLKKLSNIWLAQQKELSRSKISKFTRSSSTDRLSDIIKVK